MNLFPEGQESFHVLERRSGRLVSLEAFDTEEAAIEAATSLVQYSGGPNRVYVAHVTHRVNREQPKPKPPPVEILRLDKAKRYR